MFLKLVVVALGERVAAAKTELSEARDKWRDKKNMCRICHSEARDKRRDKKNMCRICHILCLDLCMPQEERVAHHV